MWFVIGANFALWNEWNVFWSGIEVDLMYDFSYRYVGTFINGVCIRDKSTPREKLETFMFRWGFYHWDGFELNLSVISVF